MLIVIEVICVEPQKLAQRKNPENLVWKPECGASHGRLPLDNFAKQCSSNKADKKLLPVIVIAGRKCKVRVGLFFLPQRVKFTCLSAVGVFVSWLLARWRWTAARCDQRRCKCCKRCQRSATFCLMPENARKVWTVHADTNRHSLCQTRFN